MIFIIETVFVGGIIPEQDYQFLYDKNISAIFGPGTNIIESEEGGSERYDPNRGQEVIKYVREFFDKYIPINGTSWKNIAQLKIINNDLIIN